MRAPVNAPRSAGTGSARKRRHVNSRTASARSAAIGPVEGDVATTDLGARIAGEMSDPRSWYVFIAHKAVCETPAGECDEAVRAAVRKLLFLRARALRLVRNRPMHRIVAVVQQLWEAGWALQAHIAPFGPMRGLLHNDDLFAWLRTLTHFGYAELTKGTRRTITETKTYPTNVYMLQNYPCWNWYVAHSLLLEMTPNTPADWERSAKRFEFYNNGHTVYPHGFLVMFIHAAWRFAVDGKPRDVTFHIALKDALVALHLVTDAEAPPSRFDAVLASLLRGSAPVAPDVLRACTLTHRRQLLELLPVAVLGNDTGVRGACTFLRTHCADAATREGVASTVADALATELLPPGRNNDTRSDALTARALAIYLSLVNGHGYSDHYSVTLWLIMCSTAQETIDHAHDLAGVTRQVFVFSRTIAKAVCVNPYKRRSGGLYSPHAQRERVLELVTRYPGQYTLLPGVLCEFVATGDWEHVRQCAEHLGPDAVWDLLPHCTGTLLRACLDALPSGFDVRIDALRRVNRSGLVEEGAQAGGAPIPTPLILRSLPDEVRAAWEQSVLYDVT